MAKRVVAGRFVLAEQLGAGGMGVVHRAWDRQRRGWVALKQVTDPALLAGFGAEQALRVRHRHVAGPTERVEGALTMELIRGGSLQQLLDEQGPLPTSYAVVLLDQLLAGLASIHAAGLVHCDLKPANLLLEPTGGGRPHLRIADFGVASRVLAPPGPVGAGTPGFLAPEAAAGSRPTPSQDLYAVGVLAARLLTEVGGLAPWLRSCLALEPTHRPGAAQARAWLREVGVPTGEPWRTEERPPWVPERWANC